MRNLKWIVVAGLTFVSVGALAADCPDDTRLDAVDSLTLSLNQPMESVDGVTTNGKTRIYFSKGHYTGSYAVSVGESLYRREVTLTFEEDAIRGGTLPPFSCSTAKQSTNAWFNTHHFTMEAGCPLLSFNPDRSALDLRKAHFTVGSLKYNLGERFTVQADCR